MTPADDFSGNDDEMDRLTAKYGDFIIQRRCTGCFDCTTAPHDSDCLGHRDTTGDAA